MCCKEALQTSLLGLAGLALTSNAQTEPVNIPKAKSVIQIFLWGGMSHNDTWDPKPDSGYDYMGEFPKAIPTNVPGFQIGMLFPELAKQAVMILTAEKAKPKTIPTRATALNTDVGNYRISQADKTGKTGIPDVDAIIGLLGEDKPVTG